MPKVEAKTIQKELDQNQLRPFYALVGPEKLKTDELLKRMKTAAAKKGLEVVVFDGSQATLHELIETVQSLSLFSFGQTSQGGKLLILREAEEFKELDAFLSDITALTTGTEENQNSIVLCLKLLDQRKKSSKKVLELCALVSCEPILESERGPWIQYLSKRRGLTLSDAECAALLVYEPWSLEWVERELEKRECGYDLAQASPLTGQIDRADLYVEKFFLKEKGICLSSVLDHFGDPEEALPLLGLLGWNARQLLALKSSQTQKTTPPSLAPFILNKLGAWASRWSLEDLKALNARLADLDFDFKQKANSASAGWATVLIQSLQSNAAGPS